MGRIHVCFAGVAPCEDPPTAPVHLGCLDFGGCAEEDSELLNFPVVCLLGARVSRTRAPTARTKKVCQRLADQASSLILCGEAASHQRLVPLFHQVCCRKWHRNIAYYSK
jgi:hypothetical protein